MTPTLLLYRAVATLCRIVLVLTPLIVSVACAREQGLRNQSEVIRLLSTARAEGSKTDPHGIQRVMLSSDISLAPAAERSVWGYNLRLHVRGRLFSIEAQPVKTGRTGPFSFFRDEAGILHLEPTLGRAAGAESRRWTSAEVTATPSQ